MDGLSDVKIIISGSCKHVHVTYQTARLFVFFADPDQRGHVQYHQPSRQLTGVKKFQS